MSRYHYYHCTQFYTNLRSILGGTLFLLISDTLPRACLPFKTILTPNRWHKKTTVGKSEMFTLCLDSRLGRQQPGHLPDELVQPAEDDGLLGEEDERVSKKGFPHTRLSHPLTWLLSDKIPGLYHCAIIWEINPFFIDPFVHFHNLKSFSVSSSMWLLSTSRPRG